MRSMTGFGQAAEENERFRVTVTLRGSITGSWIFRCAFATSIERRSQTCERCSPPNSSAAGSK